MNSNQRPVIGVDYCTTCRGEGVHASWCQTKDGRGLPDPLVGGPCQAQATFMCTGEAQGERLNPLAMLKDSGVSTDYVPMCRACYDHLCGEYVGHVHAIEAEAAEKWEANQW